MNTTLIHFQRDGQPLGSWPTFMVPSLLQRGDLDDADTWFVEGMPAAEPVSELMRAEAPEVGKVAVTNFPATTKPEPYILRSANVPFVDVLLVVFKVLLAVLIASPAVAVVVAVFIALTASIGAGIGVRLFGH